MSGQGVNGEDVRRRLAAATLPDGLARLGLADDDAADLREAVAAVLTRADDLTLVGSLVDRIVGRIGDFSPPAGGGWADVPQRTAGLTPGVAALLALLVSAPEVAAFHAGRGVSADISAATLADLGQQVRVHRLTYGEFGLHTQGWLSLVWSGGLYALGRLQFNLQLDPRYGWVLDTHIPATGGLDPSAVEASLAAARPFFATHFPAWPVAEVTCRSWLLDPVLATRLPGSNLASFQRRWELSGDQEPGEEDLLFFVFHRRGPVEVDELAADTRLERLAAARLRAGEGWSVRTGRLIA